MWWIVPLGIVVYILLRFAIDCIKQNSEMKENGGMRAKYSVLIDGLLRQAPNIKIQKETPTSIELSANFTTYGLSGTYAVFINHLFNNKLNVQIWCRPGNTKAVKLIDKMYEQDMPQEDILGAIIEFMGI